MRINKNSDGTVVSRNKTWSAVALLAAILGGAGAMAQADRQEVVPPALQAENDAVIEAERSEEVIIRSSKGPRVGASDEEIFLDSAPVAPKPPKVLKGPKALKSAKAPKQPKGPVVVLKKERITDAGLEQRMERLERMIEDLAGNHSEGDRIHMKNGPFEFQEKEFGRLQKEIERAGRQAEIAAKRFRGHPGMENDFVFEHKIEIAGNARMQRKALEAQRKALEKQLEVIDQRLESLEQNDEGEEGQEEGDELREEEAGRIEIQKEQKDGEPSLPPE
ncbi:MAG: DUF5320 domain-containing protein [Limisphaerales bacterium]